LLKSVNLSLDYDW